MRWLLPLFALLLSCNLPATGPHPTEVDTTGMTTAGDSHDDNQPVADTAGTYVAATADTNLTEQIVSFAETLIGIPYKYGGTDPLTGFDCSGFITYVYNRHGITVPRSSIDFTNEGIPIPLKQSLRGDLILFTGTDSNETAVGHMGIITRNMEGDISFIHSTSGKQYAVTVTPLNEYYMKRFVKVIRYRSV